MNSGCNSDDNELISSRVEIEIVGGCGDKDFTNPVTIELYSEVTLLVVFVVLFKD